MSKCLLCGLNVLILMSSDTWRTWFHWQEWKSTFLIILNVSAKCCIWYHVKERRDIPFLCIKTRLYVCRGREYRLLRPVEGKHLKRESLKRQLGILLSFVCCLSAFNKWGWTRSQSPSRERNWDWSREWTNSELNSMNPRDNLREGRS